MNSILKKVLLVLAPLALTVFLIFTFKEKSLTSIVKEQKLNLAGFYTQNLNSLLGKVGLTNDDIFDFAVQGRLPLNEKRDKFFQLNFNDDNYNSSEIIEKKINDRNKQLPNFYTKLNLNDDQQKKVDSILLSYRDKLEEQILVGENSSMAVNSNLWNLHKTIYSDIAAYAAQIDTEYKFKLDELKIKKLVAEARSFPDSQYIVFAPDTVFSYTKKFDVEKQNKNLAALEEDLMRFEKSLKSVSKNKKVEGKVFKDHGFVFADSNVVKIKVPNLHISMDKIHTNGAKQIKIELKQLDEAFKEFSKLKFLENIIEIKTDKLRKVDSVKSNFIFKMDIDSLMQLKITLPDSSKMNEMEENFEKHAKEYGEQLGESMKRTALENVIKTLRALQSANADNKEMYDELESEIKNIKKELENIKE